MKNLYSLKHIVFVILSVVFFNISSSHAQVLNFQYFDTVRYESDGFVSPETYITDINEDGVMVGYFRDESDQFTAFVYFQGGEFVTYKHPGVNNTEFSGINNANKIVGRAYDSAPSAVAIRAEYDGTSDTISNVGELAWNNASSQSRDPQKINNNDIACGTTNNSSFRWMVYRSVFPPGLTNELERFQSGSTPFNTYGTGINDNDIAVGYYLNGIERNPVIYENGEFTQLNNLTSLPTILNDINNSNYYVGEYRDAGVWRSFIAEDNIIGNSLNYDPIEQMGSTTAPFGSTLKGINNVNDVVGHFSPTNATTVGIFALSSPFTHNSFDPSIHSFSFSNTRDNFEIQSTLDYANTDPYTGESFPFRQYIESLMTLNFQQGVSLLTDERYPDWPSFVTAIGEDAAYVDTNGVTIPRPKAVLKWMSISHDDFSGACSGINIFNYQHLIDVDRIASRFPTLFDQLLLEMNEYVATENLRLMVAALQLYQFEESIVAHYNEKVDEWVGFGATSGMSNFRKRYLQRETKEISRGIKARNTAEFRLLNAYVLDQTENKYFWHSLIPIKVSRAFDLEYQSDTIYCIDPNNPLTYIKIVTEDINAAPTNIGMYDQNDNFLTLINFFYADVPFSDYEIDDFAVLKNKSLKNLTGELSSLIYFNNVCNFRIENASDPTSYIDKIGDGFTYNNIENIVDYKTFDSRDAASILLNKSDVLYKTTLENCDEIVNWSYEYEDGIFTYSRDGFNASTSADIIYNHNNYFKIENENTDEKFAKITSIKTFEDVESAITIDSIALNESDTLSLLAFSQTQLLLRNGNTTSNSYKLNVQYMDANNYFQFDTVSIPINGQTNHVITLQPNSEDEKVIILVDENQDGSFEDTLFTTIDSVITPNPTTVNDLRNSRFKIYPNPSTSYIEIDFSKNVDETLLLNVYNIDGKLMDRKTIESNRSSYIYSGKLPKGMYFFEIKGLKGVSYREKVVVN